MQRIFIYTPCVIHTSLYLHLMAEFKDQSLQWCFKILQI